MTVIRALALSSRKQRHPVSSWNVAAFLDNIRPHGSHVASTAVAKRTHWQEHRVKSMVGDGTDNRVTFTHAHTTDIHY
jgi:hypothetical protein